jgi:hypothetical protein
VSVKDAPVMALAFELLNVNVSVEEPFTATCAGLKAFAIVG